MASLSDPGKFKHTPDIGLEYSDKESPIVHSQFSEKTIGHMKEEHGSRTLEEKSQRQSKNTRKNESDSHVARGSSVSFPVKRSGLSNKVSNTTSTFQRGESDGRGVVLTENTGTKSESPHLDGKDCSGKKCSKKNGIVIESVSRRRRTSLRDSENSVFDHENHNQIQDEENVRVIDNKLKQSDISNVHQRKQKGKTNQNSDKISPSHLSPKSSRKVNPEVYPDDTDSRQDHSRSNKRIRKHSNNTLVAYNSTDEELSRDREQSFLKRKNKQKDNAKKMRVNDKISGSPVHSHGQNSSGTSRISPTAIKTVKSTAKSSWDSSDSDFENSMVRPETPTEHINISSPHNDVGIRDSRRSRSVHRISPDSHASRNTPPDDVKDDEPIRGSKHKHTRREESTKVGAVLRSTSKSKRPTKESHHRRHHKYARQHRPSGRHRQSASSDLSAHSRSHIARDDSHAKSNVSDLTPEGRKRSRSVSSYRSSRSRSRYSSRTDSSKRYGRRKRSYRKSKSYSSRSSIRSSDTSGSSYGSRSRSSSRRSIRHRRRGRSFYRRRHRRRSYSSRSPSRTWRSSDSSFSSRFSHSSRSRYSSRRNTPNNRSPSRHSRTPLYRPSSSVTKGPEENIRVPPEHRLARLGVGPVSKERTGERKTNSPLTHSRPLPSIPSVNETVTAAVKRVVGGSSLKNSKATDLIVKTPTSVANSIEVTESNTEYGPISDLQQQTSSSSSSGLVDIPLPQDATQYQNDSQIKTEKSSPSDKSIPYIGPQVPPELAKRFGLAFDSNKVSEAVPTTTGGTQQNKSNTGTVTNSGNNSVVLSNQSSVVKGEITEQPTNPSKSGGFIPPESDEQCRALQEQAKEHALRRGVLMPDDPKSVGSNANDLAFSQTQKQLTFLQQQLGQQHMVLAPGGVVYSAPSLVPLYATPNLFSTVCNANTNVGATTVSYAQSQQAAAEAIYRQHQLATLCGVYQQPVIHDQPQQPQQQSQTVVSTPHSVLSNNFTLENPFVTSVPASIKLESNSMQQQQQQAQFQQLLSTIQAALTNNAAASSVVNVSNSAGVLPQSSPSHSAVFNQQLLSRLLLQQMQSGNVNANPAVATSPLSTPLQQLKQSLAILQQQQQQRLFLAAINSASEQLKNATEKRIPIVNASQSIVNPIIGTTGNNSSAALANLGNLPLGLSLGLLRGTGTNPILPVPTAQRQISPVELLLASQQQQQQQQAAAAAAAASAAHSSLPSVPPQSSITHSIPDLTAIQQHQQRLIALALQTKQQQQQLAALGPSPVSGNAFLQAQSEMLAALQNPQRQQQLAQVQAQLQQHQAALTTNAILAAQAQQRQQAQERLAKQL